MCVGCCRDTRRDIPALPFCQARLSAPKRAHRAYPKVLRTLGDHLRKRRLDLGLLQRQVAAQLGASVDTLRKWERGETGPNIRFRPAVFRFIGGDPRPDPTTPGERLTRYREGRGITQEARARELGVDPGTLARWESRTSTDLTVTGPRVRRPEKP